MYKYYKLCMNNFKKGLPTSIYTYTNTQRHSCSETKNKQKKRSNHLNRHVVYLKITYIVDS